MSHHPEAGVPRAESDSYRLLFAIQRYFEFGGLQRDMLRIADACADRGHDVHVVSGDWSGPTPESLTVHSIAFSGRTNHGRCVAFGRAVGDFVSRRDFDCVVGFTRMAGLDVCWCGDPCLAARFGDDKPAWLRYLPRYRTYLEIERSVFGPESGAELLLLTERERQRVTDHYRPPPSRMHLLPAGIDRRRFAAGPQTDDARQRITTELGLAPGSTIVLCVGSSFSTKGVDRSITAVARLPDHLRRETELIVVGNGKPEPCRRLARRLGIERQVRFTGGRDDVAVFYHAADLLLHPARTETAGHILVEALVCGLPVLVTANCGYAFHVEQAGAGLVCPHPFVQDTLDGQLAEALDADRRELWRARARDYRDTADLYSMVDRAADVIVSRARANLQSTSSGQQRRAS